MAHDKHNWFFLISKLCDLLVGELGLFFNADFRPPTKQYYTILGVLPLWCCALLDISYLLKYICIYMYKSSVDFKLTLQKVV